MKRVTVEKAGENVHRETLWEDGRSEVFWLYDGWVVYRPMNFASDQIMALPKDSHLSPLKNMPEGDFPDLAWLQAKNFVRTETYHGQRCRYYEDKDAAPLTGGDSLSSNAPKGVHAWIDAATGLPVAVEDDAVLKTFHFSKQPSARLELTGAFAAAYEKATKKPSTENDVPKDE